MSFCPNCGMPIEHDQNCSDCIAIPDDLFKHIAWHSDQAEPPSNEGRALTAQITPIPE